ncbi:hypothetical protein D3C78_1669930 [compost metagenome]
MAHHIVVLALQRIGATLDFRVQILAMATNVQQPGHMVNACDVELDIIGRHIHAFQQRLCTDLHTVTQPHRFHFGMAQHGAG